MGVCLVRYSSETGIAGLERQSRIDGVREYEEPEQDHAIKG